MDPITAVFVSYIELAGQYTAKKALIDPLGLEVSAITVQHQYVDIPFTYQMWKVNHASVCYAYRQNASAYSQCTLAASSLFQSMCHELGAKTADVTGSKYRSLKNMYCTAAVTYQPTIADVQWSSERTELDKARRLCNTAMAAAIGSTDQKVLAEKEALCSRYKSLKSEAAR